jgi:hypothetical protein
LSNGFYNKRLKESSEAWKRDLTFKLALRTKARHGREIRKANARIGLLWTRWAQVQGRMEVDMGMMVGMRLWRRFNL